MLITVVIVLIICALLFWALDRLGVGEPFKKIIQCIIILLLIIWLLGLIGVGPALHLR